MNPIKDDSYRYISWAELRASNERMADVVSAALRWRQVVMAKELPSSDCDCVNCTLTRACDKYQEVK